MAAMTTAGNAFGEDLYVHRWGQAEWLWTSLGLVESLSQHKLVLWM
jgi:hypothetical protein